MPSTRATLLTGPPTTTPVPPMTARPGPVPRSPSRAPRLVPPGPLTWGYRRNGEGGNNGCNSDDSADLGTGLLSEIIYSAIGAILLLLIVRLVRTCGRF
jgi:hypothetical protein